jgi:CheY-specific phosphatase CheX
MSINVDMTPEEIARIRALTVTLLGTSVKNAFSMMTGMEATVGEAETEIRPHVASGRLVASLVGWIGAWNGTGVLECTPDFACKLGEILMGDESLVLNESTLDCIAEIANIVFGTMKTDLEAAVGALGLSTPTVIYGENVGMRNIGENFMVIPVTVDGYKLRLKVSMMPVNPKQSRLSHFWGGHYSAPVSA